MREGEHEGRSKKERRMLSLQVAFFFFLFAVLFHHAMKFLNPRQDKSNTKSILSWKLILVFLLGLHPACCRNDSIIESILGPAKLSQIFLVSFSGSSHQHSQQYGRTGAGSITRLRSAVGP